MPSYKLNIGRITGIAGGLTADQVAESIASWPNSPDEVYFRRACIVNGTVVTGNLTVLDQKTATVLKRETGDLDTKVIERADDIPYRIYPTALRVETYAGSLRGLLDLNNFLVGCGVTLNIENIELELAKVLETLEALALPAFRVKSVKVSDFAANSYVMGTYGPKFTDTVHGHEFVEKYGVALVGLAVAWRGNTGKVGLSLVPRSCFTFSCHEDDRESVLAVLRELAGWKIASVARQIETLTKSAS